MKKIILLSVLGLFSACVSKQSTIKNIDPTAKKPSIIKDAFAITEYATDKKYGYDEDYPINLGPVVENSENRFISLFFNGLKGENNEKITYEKAGTCCPFPSTNTRIGAGLLVIYEVTFATSNKKVKLYFNTFERGKIMCPKGFVIKKTE